MLLALSTSFVWAVVSREEQEKKILLSRKSEDYGITRISNCYRSAKRWLCWVATIIRWTDNDSTMKLNSGSAAMTSTL